MERTSDYRLLKTWSNEFYKKNLRWFTDNKNLLTIHKRGSNVDELQDIAHEIYQITKRNYTNLTMYWIPRDLNTKADQLSKKFDSDDWGINPVIIEKLANKYGNPSIDRFANSYNAKCERYNSRWWCEGAEAINAFSQSWNHEFNLIVPPPRLILEALKKIYREKANALVIIPEWQSAAYWPQLTSMVNDEEITTHVEILPKNCICQGLGDNGIFSNVILFDMIAISIKFKYRAENCDSNSLVTQLTS